MQQKKLPNSKSTEELLKDLEVPEEIIKEKIESEDTVITFLRFYNIEPGKQKVSKKLLYKLYREFTKNHLIEETFLNQMILYIPLKGGREKNFWINQKALNLSEKGLEFLAKQDKRPRHMSLPSQAHFKNFITKYNIKPGQEHNYIWVSSSILFNLYDKYVYESEIKKSFNEQSFSNICKLYFEFKISDRMWFKLNISICRHLSREMDEKYKARKRLPNEKKEEST